MTRWNNAENPEGRVWALIYTEMYDYQVAQWDPQLNEWSFYYKHVLSSVKPQYTPVWWSRLPRPPLKEQDSRLIDKIFALEPDDDA